MMTRKLLLASVLTIFAAVPAMAQIEIVVRIVPGKNIADIAKRVSGTVLDRQDDDTYLLSVSRVPNGTVKDVLSIDLNDPILLPPMAGAIFKVADSMDRYWYAAQPAMRLTLADSAVAAGATGRGIVVADINSSIDFGNQVFAGRLVPGGDFVRKSSAAELNQSSAFFLDQSAATFLDQSSATFLDQSSAFFLDQSSATFLDQSAPAHGHGTMVAGIVAAMAPGSMIMPLRAFDDNGGSSLWSITKAMKYAIKNGAHVINMSLGVSGHYKSLESAIEKAIKNNIVVVASVGNKDSSEGQYPAAFPAVIGVGATDNGDRKARFSNYGNAVFVTAPGVNIISSYPRDHNAFLSGTSFAAPMVSAQAALLLSVKTQLVLDAKGKTLSKVDSVRHWIGASAANVDDKNPGYEKKLGAGRVDFVKSLEQ